MATLLYQLPLTRREILKFNQIFESSSNMKATGCKEWTRTLTHDGYPIFRTTYRGHRMWVKAQRLAYYVAHNCSPIESGMHISHLCHNKICINPVHLHKETQTLNNNRNVCKREGVCRGHYGHPMCIL